MRFLPNRARTEPFLVLFDVGATSIGVGIFHETAGASKLLWRIRVEFSYTHENDYAHYERSMYAALLDAGMRLMHEGVRTARDQAPHFLPDRMRVVCVLAPPWFLGTVTSAIKTWDTPVSVDQRLIHTLEEEATRTTNSAEQVRAWEAVVGDAETLESYQQRLFLNGYPVLDNGGQNITSASATWYHARVSASVHQHVKEILERLLPNHVITITTSTALFARLHRAAMGSGTSHRAFLVEVGGHITSIASVRDGVLNAISTVPYGTHHVLHAAAPSVESAEEARSALFMLMKNTQHATPLPKEIQDACTDWRNAVLDVLRIHSGGSVPSELVFLLVSPRWFDVLAPVLKEPWSVPCARAMRSQVVTPASILAQTTVTKPNDALTKQEPYVDTRLETLVHACIYSPGVPHAIL